MIEYLCDKVEMNLFSNPLNQETIYETYCNVHYARGRYCIQFNFGQDVKFRSSVSDIYEANRTDNDYQSFRVSFSKDLEFLDVFDQKMYFREQQV